MKLILSMMFDQDFIELMGKIQKTSIDWSLIAARKKWFKKLQDTLAPYDEARSDILKECCKVDGQGRVEHQETGEPAYIDDEAKAKFRQQWPVFMSQEIEVDLFKREWIGSGLSVNDAQADYLDLLTTEEKVE